MPRPLKYGEPTRVVSLRLPVSLVDAFDFSHELADAIVVALRPEALPQTRQVKEAAAEAKIDAVVADLAKEVGADRAHDIRHARSRLMKVRCPDCGDKA